MQYILPLWPAYPEIFLLVMVCVILLADLFVSDDNRVVTYALTQARARRHASPSPGSPSSARAGLHLQQHVRGRPHGGRAEARSCTSRSWRCWSYSRPYIAARGMLRGEFFTLVLFATLGMMVMISANHLLIALPRARADVAVALLDGRAAARFGDGDRGGDEVLRARRARLRACCSTACRCSTARRARSRSRGSRQSIAERGIAGRRCWCSALVFIVAGLGFKLGAVPFHMWVPDVYHGAPTAVTLFIGSRAQARRVRVHHAAPRRRALGAEQLVAGMAADADPAWRCSRSRSATSRRSRRPI